VITLAPSFRFASRKPSSLLYHATPVLHFQYFPSPSEELKDKVLEAEIKAQRLRKQRRAILKRVKALGAREEANIEEMEADEAITEPRAPSIENSQGESLEGLLSPTGLSQVSFNSFDRTSLMPSGNG
jgi:cobalamin biosynthesis Mg chelatase CobN